MHITFCYVEDSPPSTPPSTSHHTSRYTSTSLAQTLQFAGLKPRHALRTAAKVFYVLTQRATLSPTEHTYSLNHSIRLFGDVAGVSIPRSDFEKLTVDCLRQDDEDLHGLSLEDFQIACSISEGRKSVAIFLCGTSGTGKSTLASILAARLGIINVVSTDSLRNVLRSCLHNGDGGGGEGGIEGDTSCGSGSSITGGNAEILAKQQQQQQQNDGDGEASTGTTTTSVNKNMLSHVLWESTYTAGAAAFTPPPPQHQYPPNTTNTTTSRTTSSTGHYPPPPSPSSINKNNQQQQQPPPPLFRKQLIQGYKAQAEAVISTSISYLITTYESRNESLIIEGVHCSPKLITRIMKKHPSVIPFLVYISNEAKHMERFAVRAKAMSLRPEGNRYVRYLHSIRAIQEYLVSTANKYHVPKCDNTNVDRSVAAIHATILGCLRKTARGESLVDGVSGKCTSVWEEYETSTEMTWSGREMLERIKKKAIRGGTGVVTDRIGTGGIVVVTGDAVQHDSGINVYVANKGSSGMYSSATKVELLQQQTRGGGIPTGVTGDVYIASTSTATSTPIAPLSIASEIIAASVALHRHPNSTTTNNNANPTSEGATTVVSTTTTTATAAGVFTISNPSGKHTPPPPAAAAAPVEKASTSLQLDSSECSVFGSDTDDNDTGIDASYDDDVVSSSNVAIGGGGKEKMDDGMGGGFPSVLASESDVADGNLDGDVL